MESEAGRLRENPQSEITCDEELMFFFYYCYSGAERVRVSLGSRMVMLEHDTLAGG